MAHSLTGNRYAKALIDLAIENKQLDAIHDDMNLIGSTIEANNELSLVLKSPIVSSTKKHQILIALFDKKIKPLSSQFLQLVSSKKRENMLEKMVSSFVSLYKKEKNIVIAEITSAVELTKNQKEKIIDLLKINATVEVVEKIDSSIIGGFVVRVNDQQIDASISRELSDLKQKLN